MLPRPVTPIPQASRGAAFEVGLVILATLLVRMIQLGAEPFWGDELFTWAWTGLGQDFIWGEGRLAENNPPLYYSLVAAWRLLAGDDEWGLRSLSAVASALAGAVCYAIGRLLLGRREALLGALAFLLLPFAWHHGQEARPVALLPLLQGLMLWALALYLNQALTLGRAPDWRRAVPAAALFVAGAAASIHVHATAILFVAAAGLTIAAAALVYPSWLGRPALLFWVATGAVTILVAAPQIAIILDRSHGSGTEWVPPLSPLVIGQFLANLVSGGVFPLKWGGFATAGLICAAAALGLARLRTAAFWVLVVTPAAFVLLLAGISLARPLFIARYAVVLVLPLALLIGAAAAPLLGGPRLRRLAAVFAVLAGVVLPGALSLRMVLQASKEDWRSLVRTYERDPACRGAAIFAPNQFATLGWPFYADAALPLPSRGFLAPEAAETIPRRAFETENGERNVPMSDFRAALAAGEPVVLIAFVDRAPELEAMLQEHGRPIVRHRFAGHVEMLCMGRG